MTRKSKSKLTNGSHAILSKIPFEPEQQNFTMMKLYSWEPINTFLEIITDNNKESICLHKKPMKSWELMFILSIKNEIYGAPFEYKL